MKVLEGWIGGNEGSGGGAGREAVGTDKRNCNTKLYLACLDVLILKLAYVTMLGNIFCSAKRSKSVDDGLWDCSVCTYKNSAEAFKCAMCDVRKGTSTRYLLAFCKLSSCLEFYFGF